MQLKSLEKFLIAFILFAVTNARQWRSRRRFCENYPFARRCLGVAAKRDVSQREPISSYEAHSKNLREILDGFRHIQDEEEQINFDTLPSKDSESEEKKITYDIRPSKDSESGFPISLLNNIIRRKPVMAQKKLFHITEGTLETTNL